MKYLKFIGVLFIIITLIGLVEKWYNMFLLGRYWEHASFLGTSIVGLIIPLGVVGLSIWGIKKIVKS